MMDIVPDVSESPKPTTATTTAFTDPAETVVEMVSSVVGAVLSPFAATTTPGEPAQTPALWTLAAFARREFEQAFSNPQATVNPMAGLMTNGLAIGTPTLSGQSIDPASTGETAPLADMSVLSGDPQPNAPVAEDPWTGEPSFVHQFFVGVFQVVGVVGKLFGAPSATSFLAPLLTSDSPPWFTTLGLNVQRSELGGMPVWTLQSPESASEKHVVALYGGGFVYQPSLLHWLDYAAMARDTGATVVVPLYPLTPQGTAATVVPQTADFLSAVIDQHGAENVSVYGDSSGAGLALGAVQELVRRGAPTPARMVLISPPLDATYSDPASQTLDDPVLNYSEAKTWARLFAGDLDLTDPRVSPLYGSLDGLPPTAVYSGSLDLLSPQLLRLRERALAEGADITFVLRRGLMHDWAVLPSFLLPEAAAVRPDIYHQLGIGSDVSLSSPNVNLVAGATTNEVVIDTATLSAQSIDPAVAGMADASLAGVSGLTTNPQPSATATAAAFTGQPSLVAQVFTAVFRIVSAVGDFLGVDLTTPLFQLISTPSPPWLTTLGLNVQRSEFDGMLVYELAPANPSGKYVVALHGGAYVVQPTILHWVEYGAMARDTGATVVVPIYPLAPQGTASTVVPQTADLISSQIEQRGAENVSIYGDSSGGGLALAAAQELVRRDDPVPSHMVLLSPWLDVSMSNPAIQFVDDPVWSVSVLLMHGQLWAGDLDPTDPLVSPLYGSLAGLPPTAVYSGNLDVLAPDVLVLQDNALVQRADFTFILRNGEIHIWPTFWLFLWPEAIAVLPDIYEQLGIGSQA
jgi:acetyl esterase/lipase